MVNRTVARLFRVAGNRIVRFHTIAHESGGIIQADVADDGKFFDQGSDFNFREVDIGVPWPRLTQRTLCVCAWLIRLC